jgi:hypothetical protein
VCNIPANFPRSLPAALFSSLWPLVMCPAKDRVSEMESRVASRGFLGCALPRVFMCNIRRA